MRKIEKTRDDAIRLQNIKQQKIEDLNFKIKAEQAAQAALNSRVEYNKDHREQKQSQKLQKAYQEMLQFEENRKKEKQRKAQYKIAIDFSK